MDQNRIRLGLFFTWDVSLRIWEEKGLLTREIVYYQKLAENEVDVTFFTWGDKDDSQYEFTLGEGIKICPVYSFMPRPRYKLLRLFLSFLMPLYLSRQIKNLDIIKTNQMQGGWTAAIAKMVYRKKLLVRSGFELYRFAILEKQNFVRKAFIWLVSIYTYSMADKIHLATEEDGKFVQNTFRVTPRKIEIYPNWIDTEKFKPTDAVRKNRSLLFVGRLNAQKNLDQLIEAIAGTDYTLTIIGKGELQQELQQLASDNGAKVEFSGPVSNEKLPDYYNSHNLFVLPSLYEGNPKSLLEAMSCGMVALGANVEGINTIIRHGVSGHLCSPDAKSIRQALKELFIDETLRLALGQEARAQILKNNNIGKQIKRELAAYELMLKGTSQ